MYAEFLSASFEVLQAADGAGALDMMRVRRPDLIVTDLSLPGIDGFQLISRVRSDPFMRGIAVICLSGYGGHAHEQRARDAGCDCILQKPCMPDALAVVALELLEAARKRQSG